MHARNERRAGIERGPGPASGGAGGSFPGEKFFFTYRGRRVLQTLAKRSVRASALARLSNHVLRIVALVPGSATSPACVVRTLRELVSHVTLAKIATDGARAHVLSLKVFDEHLPAHVLLHARAVPSFGTAVATAVMYEVVPLRCDGRQNFWRLRRAALSDLDEPKACGTREHALGGLPTNRYSQFLSRCS